MKQKMIALKPFRYATRALVTGDAFDARRSEARALEAIGKARRYVPEEAVRSGKASPNQARRDAGKGNLPKPKPEPEPDLDALRARAEELGVEVDNRWREKRLTEEIVKAANSKDVASLEDDGGASE